METRSINLEIIMLDNSHVDEIIDLRRYALSQLNNIDDYVVENDEREFVSRHLGPTGVSFGFRINGKLLGYSALTTEIYQYGDIEELAPLFSNSKQKWGALAATILAPEARGLGLQRKAINLRKKFAKEAGLTHLGAVVSTKNTASLSNLIQAGANLQRVVRFEDERVRYLLGAEVRELKKPRLTSHVISPISKNDVISHLLNKNYIGHHMITFPHGKYIKFSRSGDLYD